MKLSICMMIKNEAANLPRCLDSLKLLRDQVESELIIVDTGSEDDSVQIAKKYTDKVYHHKWNNQFSEMRNTSISYASGEWVMIVDADEELEPQTALVEFLRSKEQKKYAVVAISVKNFVSLEPEEYSLMVGFRLFRRDKHFRYEGAVHNQPVFKGQEIAYPSVCIRHYGYIASDMELMERKFIRTHGILKNELEKDPENIYYWSQLSVTYAMHNDYKEAIEAAEKAYSLLPEKRTSNHMYVFLQILAVYQHERLFEKIVQIAQEALAIKEGYLDVYYYYAEAKAVLGDFKEAVKYYEKYLEFIENYDKQTERDVSLVEYTLCYLQIAYYNMSQICTQEKLYDRAIECGEKLTDDKYVRDNMLNLIELYLYKKEFEKLKKYYMENLKVELREAYSEILVKKIALRDESEGIGIAHEFCDLENEFGLLCRLVIEDVVGEISAETQKKLSTLNLETLPKYCSTILYYLLKWNVSLAEIASGFKEVWLSNALGHVAEQKTDLSDVLLGFLQKSKESANLSEVKLTKTLARCTLLLGQLSVEQYKAVFGKYLKSGIAYLRLVYSNAVLAECLKYEVKNDEEVFLLCMNNALVLKNTKKSVCIENLRNALQVMPEMKRGIEILLNEIKEAPSDEMNQLVDALALEVRKLIERREFATAETVLSEGEKLAGKNERLMMLKAELFCRKMDVK